MKGAYVALATKACAGSNRETTACLQAIGRTADAGGSWMAAARAMTSEIVAAGTSNESALQDARVRVRTGSRGNRPLHP